ncbi:transposase domain-containing protein [Gigaspora margarita]|uniref:Transposase domain-containing protein n=1 Tax=Gigaspora margarita TaxID=4874 RepID=A0A8H4A3F4_GIGMA|nr:transposase domain-containing protein [Gigaspora margarita]
MYRFLFNTYNIQESVITGSERLFEYYTVAYENLSFRKPFANNLDDSIIVLNRANQYGRCKIGSEIFGSDMSSRHVKSSFVLAQFVNQDGSIDLYPKQVQYFISHSINLLNGFIEHKLAYIK